MATVINDIFEVWDDDAWAEDIWGIDAGGGGGSGNEDLLNTLYYKLRRLVR